MQRALGAAMVAIVGLVVTACGGGGAFAEGHAVPVEVHMTQGGFSPASVSVVQGDRVTFVVHNDDAVPHEAYLAPDEAQADHALASGDGIVVAPGTTRRFAHVFDVAANSVIGSHEPGDWPAMRLDVHVT
ncbi:MAG: cupredoxin domain-containing protein [Acidobacteria bacterium]|nr:cupredoxin domain-containing protein [Acidobacteriota bacterium]